MSESQTPKVRTKLTLKKETIVRLSESESLTPEELDEAAGGNTVITTYTRSCRATGCCLTIFCNSG
jgi:hypothetical protein